MSSPKYDFGKKFVGENSKSKLVANISGHSITMGSVFSKMVPSDWHYNQEQSMFSATPAATTCYVRIEIPSTITAAGATAEAAGIAEAAAVTGTAADATTEEAAAVIGTAEDAATAEAAAVIGTAADSTTAEAAGIAEAAAVTGTAAGATTAEVAGMAEAAAVTGTAAGATTAEAAAVATTSGTLTPSTSGEKRCASPSESSPASEAKRARQGPVELPRLRTPPPKSVFATFPIGDYSKLYTMPISKVEYDGPEDVVYITYRTLTQLLTLKYKELIPDFVIIDCRNPYEYYDGHISRSVNFYTEMQILDNLIRSLGEGQSNIQPGFPPMMQPGFRPMMQPGFSPMTQPGFPPMTQPGFPPMAQPRFPPMMQPGFAPMMQPGFSRMTQPGFPPMTQPGFPPMAQPGFPPMAQPGFPPMAQPRFPTMTQPGFPSMTQPGFPPMTQPGFSSMTQPGFPPMMQPGFPPMTQPGFPPMTQPRFPPMTQPGFPPMTQPGFPPMTQPGFPPMTQPRFPPMTQPGFPPMMQPAFPPMDVWFPPREEFKAKAGMVVIFYDEDGQTAPAFYKYLRSVDRKKHSANFPDLYYPEMYCLEGGYRKFLAKSRLCCVLGPRPVAGSQFAHQPTVHSSLQPGPPPPGAFGQ